LLERELGSLPVEAETRSRLAGRIATLEEGAERMATIVRDLRNFCRPSSPLLGPIDVRQVLESAINMAMNELRDRARLVRDYAPVPAVIGDSAQLGQVFLNLLLNAAQALPEGHAADNEVRVTVASDGCEQVWIEVADSGHGIAPELRDRIFEPFFTTKAMSVGTGLGLPICRSIVSSMRGVITVESEVGRGTKFRISLPVSPTQPVEEAASPSSDQRHRQRQARAKVLVVDDEALIASALVKVLELEHEVTSVTSGEHALQLLLRGASFDVILCDVSMPGTSGIDLYHTLQRFRPELAPRIIFMSGGSSMPVIADFLARVSNRHIDKPVDLALLRTLIRKTSGA
jgi:CheY-like chemotaxis protein